VKQRAFENGSSKLLRGDLDNILLMALRKDPVRRYSSVEQFSEDLRRHLEGLPVIARPDTLTYRTGKFIQRHRAATIGAGLVAVTLLGGICTTAYQAREANRERALAERRFSEVRQLANSVVFKYHDAIQTLPGSTKVREMLVKDALTYLDNLSSESSADRGLQRELALAYLKVADVQGKIYDANLGDMAGALSSYRKAIALFEALAQNTSDIQAQIDLRNAYQALALTFGHSGDPQAREFIEKAIRLSEDLGNRFPDDPEHQLMLARGYILKVDSSALPVSERFATYAKALAIVERLVQQQPANTEALKSLAIIHQRLGDQSFRAAKATVIKDPAEASKLFQQAADNHRLSGLAVDRLLKLEPKNNVYLRLEAIAANNLGEALLETGDTKTGVASIGGALSYFETNARTDPANLNAQYELALSLKTYMRALLRNGQVTEAKQQYVKVASITEQLIKRDSKNREYIGAAVDLREETGDLMLSLRNFPEALAQYQLARLYMEKIIELAPHNRPGLIARSDEKLGDYHAALAASSNRLKARTYWIEARRLYQSALDATKETSTGDELSEKIANCDKALASF
jgi:non-specific serine/threonine protein kinase/serine/threonine-protein kinase